MVNYLLKDEKYFYGAVPIEIEVEESKRQMILSEFPIPEIPVGEEGIFDLKGRNKLKDAVLLVSEHVVKPTNNGGVFLEIKFGNFKAKMWDKKDSVNNMLKKLEKHAVFTVSGDVQEYPAGSGIFSLVISEITPYEGDIEPFKLIDSTSRSLEDMTLELYTYLDSLVEPHRSLALKGMKKYWHEFVVKPAAKGHHHAYLSGLLKHTVGLMRLAVYITKKELDPYQAMLKLIAVAEKTHKRHLYESLNSDKVTDTRKLPWFNSLDHVYGIFYEASKLKNQPLNADLLIASIFYHDIGKIFEYTHAGESDKFKLLFPTLNTNSTKDRRDSGIAMDSIGLLVGHIPYGVMVLKDIIETEKIDISIEDVHLYFHSILAHHGKLEWGSAIKGNTMEAHLLHFVDFLDSRWENNDEIK